MESETLSQDPSKYRLIVGNVLAALVASEGAASASVLRELSTAERSVVSDWAAQARVNLDNLDSRGRTKLLNIANETLISLAVGNVNPRDANAKLGTLGILSPAKYAAKATPRLLETLSLAGLTLKDARDAIHHPDAYQHLSPPSDFGEDDTGRPSLFVRQLNRSEADPADWLFVIGLRTGSAINMYTALRMFGDDVRLDRDKSSPVDLLRAFAESFGLDFKIGGTPVGKFCVYKSVSGLDSNLQVLKSSEGPEIDQYSISLFVKLNPKMDRTEIALAFVADTAAYRRSLARHKVGPSKRI